MAWTENKALFHKGKAENPIHRSYDVAKRELSGLPNPYNPQDFLFSHSVRVASKISELIDDPLRRQDLVSGALLMEVALARQMKTGDVMKLVYDKVNYNVWSFILSYQAHLPPDHNNVREVVEKRLSYSKVVGTPEQTTKDALFLFAVNELDFLNSQIDFLNDLSQHFGDNGLELFLGSLPFNLTDHVWIHERLIAELNQHKESASPEWKVILDEYDERLKQLQEISLEHVEEPKITDIRKYENNIFKEELSSIKKRNIQVSSSVKGNENGIEEIEINLYSFTNSHFKSDREKQKQLVSKCLKKIYKYCLAQDVSWKGLFKVNFVDQNGKNILDEQSTVALNDFVDTFSFNLENPRETFQNMITFSLMVGNSTGRLFVTSYDLEKMSKVAPQVLASKKEEDRSPASKLLYDSHLFLPYITPLIIELLKKTGLTSEDGLKSLILAALSNMGAWVDKDIYRYIHEKTPRGIFDLPQDSYDFLYYIADTFRESFGKSKATTKIFGDISGKEFKKLYLADVTQQKIVFEALKQWYLGNPHKSKDADNKNKKMNYYDELILAALSNFV